MPPWYSAIACWNWGTQRRIVPSFRSASSIRCLAIRSASFSWVTSGTKPSVRWMFLRWRLERASFIRWSQSLICCFQ